MRLLLVAFTVSGCVGTAPAQPLDPARCDQPTDCAVFSRTCCGTCGAATRGNAVAYNRNAVQQGGRPRCTGGSGCPDCTMRQDPSLVAVCRANRCEVVDLGARRYTRCGADEECRARTASCCECGATPESVVAIRVESAPAVSRLLCGAGTDATVCPACAPNYAETAARCLEGRCRVVDDAGNPLDYAGDPAP